MIIESQPKFVQPRVFYSGLAIAAGLVVVDFLLLAKAQGNPQQLKIFAVLFSLSMMAVVYRYRSKNEQLKRLGARGIWFLILILIGTAAIIVYQSSGNPANDAVAPAAAEPAPKDGG